MQIIKLNDHSFVIKSTKILCTLFSGAMKNGGSVQSGRCCYIMANAITMFLCVFTLISSLVYANEKHALLIGISNYENAGFDNLDGPVNDLNIVRKVLQSRFEFKDDNITVIWDKEATHTGIERAFSSLANKIKTNDNVYIHYSGHGSVTPDLNGDERSGEDQTWVLYGARCKSKDAHSNTHKDNKGISLDDYDLLDDEINQLLAPICAKTDNVIFVSDSCHSASVTRGSAPKMRSVAKDNRLHPLGKDSFEKTDPASGIWIGAARDDEGAQEFRADDGKSYGLFTWYWVETLQNSEPGDTWNDIFREVSTLIKSKRGWPQNPRIAGNTNREVFGRDFKESVKVITVDKVMEGGKIIHIGAGAIQGVTEGSVYVSAKHKESKTADTTTIVITNVMTFFSEGKVSKAGLSVGDFVVEDVHAYPYEPMKVFFMADLESDRALLGNLIKEISILPNFIITDTQKESDLVIFVVRPKIVNSKLLYKSNAHTLPVSFKANLLKYGF